jgi:hypothetical protein
MNYNFYNNKSRVHEHYTIYMMFVNRKNHYQI